MLMRVPYIGLRCNRTVCNSYKVPRDYDVIVVVIVVAAAVYPVVAHALVAGRNVVALVADAPNMALVAAGSVVTAI